MFDHLLQFLHGYVQTILHLLPLTLALGAAFPLLTVLSARCNDQGHWWRNPGLIVDLCYWFVLPLTGSLMRTGFLIGGAVLFFGIRGSEALEAFFDKGHGPLSALPFWGQVIAYLILADVMLYWTHRIFHGPSLWRYHAIHHSSVEVDWTSAQRFHPVNIALHSVVVDAILLLFGIAPEVLVMLAPFNVAMSAFVHANLDWSLGPFKYVIAGPVFHRWHHTDVARGGEKNFAPTFPVLDLIFGTFYMPDGVLPDEYGVDDEHFPESFLAQLLYPFKKPVEGSAFGHPASPRVEARAG